MHFFKSFSDTARCNSTSKPKEITSITRSKPSLKPLRAIRMAVKRGDEGHPKHQRGVMIAIIKYNAGNTTSVKNAVERLGIPAA